jgi:protocatechuate 3,4-dioxygenase beta subunit
MTMSILHPNRRQLILGGAVAAAGVGGTAGATMAQGNLAATPACDDHPTLRQMDGPFYKPRSPERVDLIEPGARARPVELFGTVMTRSCQPVPRALIDLWHADDNGDYDETGFRYRGHVYTGPDGGFRFRTIVPALYPGRTRHYHVKVFLPGRPLLTTQLYFPNEPMNGRDELFRRALLLRTAQAQDSLSARFDFVLDLR